MRTEKEATEYKRHLEKALKALVGDHRNLPEIKTIKGKLYAINWMLNINK